MDSMTTTTDVNDDTIGITQVTRLTGIGRTRLFMLVRAGLFPDQCDRSRSRWDRVAVVAWMRRKKDPPSRTRRRAASTGGRASKKRSV